MAVESSQIGKGRLPTTREVINSFIKRRIQRSVYANPNAIVQAGLLLEGPINFDYHAVVSAAREIERNFNEDQRALVMEGLWMHDAEAVGVDDNLSNLDDPHIIAQYTNYRKVLQRLLRDGEMSWEQIVMFLVTAAEIGESAVRANRPRLAYMISSWTAGFFARNNIEAWINANRFEWADLVRHVAGTEIDLAAIEGEQLGSSPPGSFTGRRPPAEDDSPPYTYSEAAPTPRKPRKYHQLKKGAHALRTSRQNQPVYPDVVQQATPPRPQLVPARSGSPLPGPSHIPREEELAFPCPQHTPPRRPVFSPSVSPQAGPSGRRPDFSPTSSEGNRPGPSDLHQQQNLEHYAVRISQIGEGEDPQEPSRRRPGRYGSYLPSKKGKGPARK